MAYKPRHFLREWREFRGKTLEQVAEAVEIIGATKNLGTKDDLVYPDSMTYVTLSRIENGRMPYRQQLLEILAEIYQTEPASLIMRNPKEPDAVYSIWENIPIEQRQTALTMLQALAGKATGTNG